MTLLGVLAGLLIGGATGYAGSWLWEKNNRVFWKFFFGIENPSDGTGSFGSTVGGVVIGAYLSEGIIPGGTVPGAFRSC